MKNCSIGRLVLQPRSLPVENRHPGDGFPFCILGLPIADPFLSVLGYGDFLSGDNLSTLLADDRNRSGIDSPYRNRVGGRVPKAKLGVLRSAGYRVVLSIEH